MDIIKFHLSSSLAALAVLGVGGLSAHAEADNTGTLSVTQINSNPTGNGEYGSSGAPLTDTASYAAGSSKKGTTAESGGGDTFTITLQFTTDYLVVLPPSSVAATYTATMKGSGSYNMIGTPNPSGGVSGMYTGTVTKNGAGQTLTDSFDVPQGANPQTQSLTPKSQDVSNGTLSTPSSGWTFAGVPNGPYTYTTGVTLLSLSASTTASAPIPGPYSPNYAEVAWSFSLGVGDLTVAASG